MCIERVLVIFGLFVTQFSMFVTQSVYNQDVPQTTTTLAILAEGEKKMSERILEILEHFKQDDPVGIPGADIPDPYPVPDMTKPIAVGTLYFKDTAVHGFSKFRILYVNADIESMEAQAAMMVPELQAHGNYTYCSFMCFSREAGPFTVNITGLKVTGRATLGVELDGRLRAKDISIDITFDKITLNFENLGIFGSMIQGIINSLSDFIFETIKPFILSDSYIKIRQAINTQLDEVVGDMLFPNTLSPLDMVIVDARNAMREKGMDPYKIRDQNANEGLFSVALSNTWVTGLSTFHRIGNITLRMEKHHIVADFEIGTQKLEGTTQWDLSAFGLVFIGGTTSFSFAYMHGRIILSQSLDTRKRPELKDFILDLGNIQVRCDGAGTLDYVVEFIVNILPNLLRYQLIETLEGPIKVKLQEELKTINIEEMIKEKLPLVDHLHETGFQLATLRDSTNNNQYDEDEFFNF